MSAVETPAGMSRIARAAAPSAPHRWAALGDSFTAGTSPEEMTWARIVVAELAPAHRIELECLARVGATVADVEREQLPLALSCAPSVVTLICGGNDIIGRVRPAPTALEDRFDRMWAALGDAHPEARLLTATYPAVASEALRWRTRRRVVEGIRRLNGAIRAAAGRHGVTCIELADHPGRGERANFAADGLHPSPAGHRAAAAAIGPVVGAMLARPEPKEED